MQSAKLKNMSSTLFSLGKTTAAASQRYESKRAFERSHLSWNPKIELPTSCPSGFSRYVHPEGKPYFYHPTKRLVTEASIDIPDIAHAIERYYTRFETLVGDSDVFLSESIDLVLDYDHTRKKCGYYLIDYSRRCQFWLDSTDTKTLGMEMSINQYHLALQLDEHFWTHVEYYPMHRKLPEGSEEKIIAFLSHAIADQLTSDESTAPYSARECERFIKVVNNFRGDSGLKRCVIARIYRVFVHSQFINFYGEDGARLARTQKILDEDLQGHTLECVMKPFWVLLFNFPKGYEHELTHLWVDRVVYIEHWQKFVDGLVKDWSRSVVLSMSFLTLDVILLVSAFDAPPSVFFYVAASSVFALSGIASGLLHIRQHGQSVTGNAFVAGQYLEKHFHPQLGFSPVSVSYAIPSATTLWAMTAFAVGLTYHTFAFLDGAYAVAFLALCMMVLTSLTWLLTRSQM